MYQEIVLKLLILDKLLEGKSLFKIRRSICSMLS